ncbi:MAG: Rho termination factor N-terminal domain-containing protein [Acholeplasmataceae bacterium]|jgi:hypothetical protein
MKKLWSKLKTYYSYNKYRLPIIFSLIGMFLLTAFPGLHYEYWYEKDSKFNAISVFLIMILAVLQLVNAINLSAKKDKKTEYIFTILFTVFNVIIGFFAYLYISPYFDGWNSKYFKSIFVILLGIVFFIIANVFAFIYLGYDTKASLNEIIAQLNAEDEEAIDDNQEVELPEEVTVENTPKPEKLETQPLTKLELEAKTVAELKELAKENNLTGYSTLKKTELVDLLVREKVRG